MSATFIYVTVPTEEAARMIARAVVEDRLAACANILPGMQSLYHWKGEVQEAREAVLIFKTRSSLFQALEARVRELHPYNTPCIVALPVEQGHAAYLEWILAETKP